MKKILYHFDDVVASVAFVITVSIVIINVFCRYFFNITFQWAEELASICFVWVVFVGAASVYKHKGHVGIDVFVNLFKGRAHQFITLIIELILIFANILMCYLSAEFAIFGSIKPTGVLRIPYTYINIAATVGFALMIIYSINFFIHDLKNFISRRDSTLQCGR